MDDVVDLLIPRGSNEFVRYIMENTKIPVLGHADGICALYIDSSADLAMAVPIAVDSKCQYPAVCNAVETILVHASVADAFIPRFAEAVRPWSVVIHGDDRVCDIIDCIPAQSRDWDTEYLDYEVAVKVVDSLDEAIEHIARHGSSHTDGIVTSDENAARIFLRKVDSADVFWNCSTRFADGFRYGLGAEVGISTQKIHARGPVGMDGLVIGKWLLKGNGHIVDTYAKGKSFAFKELSVDGANLFQEDDA
jgi:glutamate-5-semialdehyde dehydrogenase